MSAPTVPPPPGRAAALATVGTGLSRLGLLVLFAVAAGACTLFGAVKGNALIGLVVGLPAGALLTALNASLRVGAGADWFAQRALGRTRWVDLPSLQDATVRKARNGQRRLALRDAEGRRVRVDLAMAADPAVLAVLRAAIPDHNAAGFDETFRSVLRPGHPGAAGHT